MIYSGEPWPHELGHANLAAEADRDVEDAPPDGGAVAANPFSCLANTQKRFLFSILLQQTKGRDKNIGK